MSTTAILILTILSQTKTASIKEIYTNFSTVIPVIPTIVPILPAPTNITECITSGYCNIGECVLILPPFFVGNNTVSKRVICKCSTFYVLAPAEGWKGPSGPAGTVFLSLR